MASGLANVLADPSVGVVSVLEPRLVEVAVWFPFGASDEAVAAAAATVADLLARPDLGAALAESPDADDASRRVATAEMVQAVARAVTEAAREIAAAAILDVFTSPKKLRAMLPDTQPATPETPWRDGDTIAFTPPAPAA